METATRKFLGAILRWTLTIEKKDLPVFIMLIVLEAVRNQTVDFDSDSHLPAFTINFQVRIARYLPMILPLLEMP